MGHLNINSIPNKFNGIMDVVGKNGVFMKGLQCPIGKIGFLVDGVSSSCNDSIPFRKLQEHSIPDDIEILYVEINLKKQKWVIIGICNPPNMTNKYFLDHLCKTIDLYSRKCSYYG